MDIFSKVQEPIFAWHNRQLQMNPLYLVDNALLAGHFICKVCPVWLSNKLDSWTSFA